MTEIEQAQAVQDALSGQTLKAPCSICQKVKTRRRCPNVAHYDYLKLGRMVRRVHCDTVVCSNSECIRSHGIKAHNWNIADKCACGSRTEKRCPRSCQTFVCSKSVCETKHRRACQRTRW